MNVCRGLLRLAGWWVFFMLVMGIGLQRLQGCRTMSPIVFEPRNPGTILFDADFETKLESLKPNDVMGRQWLEGNLPYKDTLSPPIAITSWQGDASTWEVFFATNRGFNPATAGTGQERFGNQKPVQSPYYGRAQVVLPGHVRGVDPVRGEVGVTKGATPQAVAFEEVRSLPWDAMAEGLRRQISRSRQQDLLLLVHGFNVDFESALIRTAQLALDIPFNGAVVAYSWPSLGGYGNYEEDEEINAQSVEPFTEFLQRLIAVSPQGTRINIVVHSMGNRIVMQALGRLPPVHSQKPIAELVLCAPDVGISDYKDWAPGVLAQCERVTLYTSSHDAALVASKSMHRHEQRAGHAHPPICLPGIETIDVSSIDNALLELGHSYYGSNVNLLSDLFFLLKEHRGADERRYLSRGSFLLRAGHYWQFHDEATKILCSWKSGETVAR